MRSIDLLELLFLISSVSIIESEFINCYIIFHLYLTNWCQFLGVCPVIDHEFRHNIVNNRTDALKTDINLLFTITDCRISRSLSLAHASHEFQIHVSDRILTIKFSQWARVNFCSYRKNGIWAHSSARNSFATSVKHFNGKQAKLGIYTGTV